MTMRESVESALLWCTVINYALLMVWVAMVVFAKEPCYRLTSRWFSVPLASFDLVNYAGIAAYKLAILMFNLVPLLALHLSD
jgi:hypothetical protein